MCDAVGVGYISSNAGGEAPPIAPGKRREDSRESTIARVGR